MAFASLTAAIGAWKIREQVIKLHMQINSRMTELLDLTKSSAHAEGVKQEQDANDTRR